MLVPLVGSLMYHLFIADSVNTTVRATMVFGGIIFFLGGFIAGKLFICLRSGGVLTMVVSIAYGYHNEFTPTVLFIIFVGFVFACFNTTRRSDNGWGIDMDFSSFGSSSDSGGDGGD